MQHTDLGLPTPCRGAILLKVSSQVDHTKVLGKAASTFQKPPWSLSTLPDAEPSRTVTENAAVTYLESQAGRRGFGCLAVTADPPVIRTLICGHGTFQWKANLLKLLFATSTTFFEKNAGSTGALGISRCPVQ